MKLLNVCVECREMYSVDDIHPDIDSFDFVLLHQDCSEFLCTLHYIPCDNLFTDDDGNVGGHSCGLVRFRFSSMPCPTLECSGFLEVLVEAYVELKINECYTFDETFDIEVFEICSDQDLRERFTHFSIDDGLSRLEAEIEALSIIEPIPINFPDLLVQSLRREGLFGTFFNSKNVRVHDKIISVLNLCNNVEIIICMFTFNCSSIAKALRDCCESRGCQLRIIIQKISNNLAEILKSPRILIRQELLVSVISITNF